MSTIDPMQDADQDQASGPTDVLVELGEPSGRHNGELTWRDRGYIPHVDGKALIQHVILQLADAIAPAIWRRFEREVAQLPPVARREELYRKVNSFLDAGHGSKLLADPGAGALVQDALLKFHGDRYHLHEWCVMPNHVHVLVEPMNAWPLGKIVATWKSYTGRRLNDRVERTALKLERRNSGASIPVINRVWLREYWDRYIRNAVDLANVSDYIRMNPVVAGLVKEPEEWPFASPGHRRTATHQRGAEDGS